MDDGFSCHLAKSSAGDFLVVASDEDSPRRSVRVGARVFCGCRSSWEILNSYCLRYVRREREVVGAVSRHLMISFIAGWER